MNIVVMKFSGEIPEINEEVMITSIGTVCKSTGKDMSRVIGDRVYDDGDLSDDEIKVCLIGGIIDNRNESKALYTTETDVLKVIEQAGQQRNNPQPLFTSKVDARGRLTIRSDVRQRKGIQPGDSVDVFEIEKVVDDDN